MVLGGRGALREVTGGEPRRLDSRQDRPMNLLLDSRQDRPRFLLLLIRFPVTTLVNTLFVCNSFSRKHTTKIKENEGPDC